MFGLGYGLLWLISGCWGLVLFVWLALLCCVMNRYCDLCCFGVACLRCGFEFRFA